MQRASRKQTETNSDSSLLLDLQQEMVLQELDRADSEASLLNFIRLAWPVLEPERLFVLNWHIEAICDHLEAVSRDEIRRLLINVPP